MTEEMMKLKANAEYYRDLYRVGKCSREIAKEIGPTVSPVGTAILAEKVTRYLPGLINLITDAPFLWYSAQPLFTTVSSKGTSCPDQLSKAMKSI